MHKYGLYIDWHLLSALNHLCPYSYEPDSAINERYSRELLLENAYYLLSLNRPEYIVRFYGGEPSLHPHFPELFNYLATSNSNFHFIIDTNGLRKPEYYNELLRNAQPAQTLINIHVHLKYIGLEEILLLIASINKHGQLCRVIVNHVPEFTDKARDICLKLIIFRKTLPFDLAVRFPMGGNVDWAPLLLSQFQGCQSAMPFQIPKWEFETPPSVAQNSKKNDCYYCVGLNSIHISSEGARLTGVIPDDSPFGPAILTKASLRPGMPAAPSFASKEQAKNFLADYLSHTIAFVIEGGPTRSFLSGEPTIEQQMLSELKHLQPENGTSEKLNASPELWEEMRGKLITVYETLTDFVSRTVFIRRLKAQLLGKSSYLTDLKNESHPFPDNMKADGFHYIHIEGADPIKEINNLLPRIKWFNSYLKLVLPEDSTWFKVILELHNILSSYNIALEQCSLNTILKAWPQSSLENYLPILMNNSYEHPLLSIIIFPTGNEKDLRNTLANVLEAGIQSYEVFVILDVNTESCANVVNEFAQYAAGSLRTIYCKEKGSITAALNTGLALARGDYACFLRAGDILETTIVNNALRSIANEPTDVVIFSCVDLKEKILDQLINGCNKLESIFNKIYCCKLLREKNLFFANLQDNVPDRLFNFFVFSFAQKILCLSGDGVVSGNSKLQPEAKDVCQSFFALLGRLNLFMAIFPEILNYKKSEDIALRMFYDEQKSIADTIYDLESSTACEEAISIDSAIEVSSFHSIPTAICRELAKYCEALTATDNGDASTTEVICNIYDNNNNSIKSDYLLSFVIIANKQSFNSLLNILNHYKGDVEYLIIDNAMDKDVTRRFETYADMYPSIKLCRISSTQHPSVVYNKVVELCQGKTIIFADSKVEFTSDFLTTVFNIISNSQNDIYLFDIVRDDEDNSLSVNIKITDNLLETCFARRRNLELVGILFNRNYLIDEKIYFNSSSPEWRQDFTLRAILQGKCKFIPQIACFYHKCDYEIKVCKQSLQLYFELYNIFQTFVSFTKWNRQALINLQKYLEESINNVLLPLYAGSQINNLDHAPMPWMLINPLFVIFAKHYVNSGRHCKWLLK